MGECRACTFLLLASALGCSKADPSPASPQAVDSAPTAAIARTTPSAATGADAGGGGAWAGHYTAGPGTFFVPDGGEWAGVRFRGEDASVGLGDGAMGVLVDPAGHVQGTLEGPLGALRVTGALDADAFSAALVSSDPAQGFAGTAVGTVAGGRITGTMRLALPTGNVLREASFTLERKP
jgi:hypothetical protein